MKAKRTSADADDDTAPPAPCNAAGTDIERFLAVIHVTHGRDLV
jgi:hypothetical protein